MQPALQELVKLHAEMETITLEAGVPKRIFDFMIHMPADILPREILARADWLHQVRYREYEAVRDIWSEIPPNVWRMYESLNGKTLTGHAALIKARKALKKAWKDWYANNQTETEVTEQEVDSEASV